MLSPPLSDSYADWWQESYAYKQNQKQLNNYRNHNHLKHFLLWAKRNKKNTIIDFIEGIAVVGNELDFADTIDLPLPSKTRADCKRN